MTGEVSGARGDGRGLGAVETRSSTTMDDGERREDEGRPRQSMEWHQAKRTLRRPEGGMAG